MYRNLVIIVVILLAATIPLVAQDDDTPVEPEGPRSPHSFTITKGSLSRDIGWIYAVVVNTRPCPDCGLLNRSASGRFSVGPGFYEVHQLVIGDDTVFLSGNLALRITASSCGRRNVIIDDSRRDELILNCDAEIAWALDTASSRAAFVIVQIEDWSEE